MVYILTKQDKQNIKAYIIGCNATALGEDDIEELVKENSLAQVIFGWMHLGDDHWDRVRRAFEYHVGKHHPELNKSKST